MFIHVIQNCICCCCCYVYTLFITSVTVSQSVDWIHNKNVSILIKKWYEMIIHVVFITQLKLHLEKSISGCCFINLKQYNKEKNYYCTTYACSCIICIIELSLYFDIFYWVRENPHNKMHLVSQSDSNT